MVNMNIHETDIFDALEIFLCSSHSAYSHAAQTRMIPMKTDICHETQIVEPTGWKNRKKTETNQSAAIFAAV